jgi:hypothetical protein
MLDDATRSGSCLKGRRTSVACFLSPTPRATRKFDAWKTVSDRTCRTPELSGEGHRQTVASRRLRQGCGRV